MGEAAWRRPHGCGHVGEAAWWMPQWEAVWGRPDREGRRGKAAWVLAAWVRPHGRGRKGIAAWECRVECAASEGRQHGGWPHGCGHLGKGLWGMPVWEAE